MSLYNTFKTSKSLETEGVWLEYGKASDGVTPLRIRIARSGGDNKAYTKAMERAAKPFRKSIQAGTFTNDQATELQKNCFVDHCILDWMGVEDETGKTLTFNRENVLKVMNDLPDLYADLVDQAASIALFREEVLEADLGNSGRSSLTDSSKGQ